MQHFILRCKHCHKEYVYCTYGNKDGCSMDYCGECQKAIDEALGKIPVRYKEYDEEIPDITGELKEKLEGIKTESFRTPEWWKSAIFSRDDASDYDFIEEYQYKNRKYKVKWNEDTPDDKHYYRVVEYDIIEDKVGSKAWTYEGMDSYTTYRNLSKQWKKWFQEDKKMEANPIAIEPPTGKLFYLDAFSNCEWDIETPHKKKTWMQKIKDKIKRRK